MAFEFLPSISLSGTDNWTNHTKWIEATDHRFKNLHPFTNYNVTVYVRIKNGNGTVFIPYLYFNATTSEGIPSIPQSVTVTQVNGSRVQVNWEEPSETSGILTAYTVYYTLNAKTIEPSQSTKVSAQEHSVVFEYDFKPNMTYFFWVRAKNTRHESPPSKLVSLTFDGTSNIDAVYGLRIVSQNDTSITLSWNPIKVADGYVIQPLLPQSYPKVESIKTTNTTVTIRDLVPGTQYLMKVSGFVKNYFGRPATLVVIRTGEALPVVTINRKSNEAHGIKLGWAATRSNAKVTYGVYYGTSMDELFESKCINSFKRFDY